MEQAGELDISSIFVALFVLDGSLFGKHIFCIIYRPAVARAVLKELCD